MSYVKIPQIEAGYGVNKANAYSAGVHKSLFGRFTRIVSDKNAITALFMRYFWIFMVCCVAGLVVEEIYHLAVFHEIENRTGLLFGPFSPIYGIGGMCIIAAS